MSQNQEQRKKPLNPASEPTGDQLEVAHTVDPPPITDTLDKVSAAVSTAQRVRTKVKRRHRCRVCHNDNCPHFKREYVDTLEHLDLGYEAPDLDNKRK